MQQRVFVSLKQTWLLSKPITIFAFQNEVSSAMKRGPKCDVVNVIRLRPLLKVVMKGCILTLIIINDSYKTNCAVVLERSRL